MNKVMLVGNCVAKPEVKDTAGGNTVAQFSVATREATKDKSGEWVESAEFHNIVVWGRQATTCRTFLDKGSKVAVDGKLKTQKWEKDGVKRWKTEVIANNVEFVGPKKEQATTTEPNTNSFEQDDFPPF